jgi:predicted phage replisome organizer
LTDTKKYYWLKLKSDFFTSKRIKKLRRMAGGDTFTIIYLKMQLAAIKTEGVLEWTGVEDDFAAELALDLDESVENVQMTLAFLLANGLIETSDNQSFFLPYAVENTGSETDAAERMRRMRERNNVTPLLHPCYTDKEKEREIKKELKIDLYKDFADGDSELYQALKEHEEMRKKIKKPMTDGAKKRMITELKKYPREEWIPMLNQSTDHCWQGVFPLDKKAAPAKQVDRSFIPTVF